VRCPPRFAEAASLPSVNYLSGGGGRTAEKLGCIVVAVVVVIFLLLKLLGFE